MATILQQYKEALGRYQAQIASGTFQTERLMALQETGYRICVLETFQALRASLPCTTDIHTLGLHYSVASLYLNMAARERKFGKKADGGRLKRREELGSQLAALIQAMESKLSHFQIQGPDSYKRYMEAVFDAALPTWLEYRDTYVDLKAGQDALAEGAGHIPQDSRQTLAAWQGTNANNIPDWQEYRNAG